MRADVRGVIFVMNACCCLLFGAVLRLVRCLRQDVREPSMTVKVGQSVMHEAAQRYAMSWEVLHTV